MSKVIFKNKGEIDIRAVTTMGVSVKADSAIGYFGTGLKFAIATVLRNRGKITIYSGVSVYSFEVVKEDIRGKDFDIVSMNGSPLGFTTQLGRDWEPWMAVREILCNCEDEKGEHGIDLDFTPDSGSTVVEVDCDVFTKAYFEKDDYILNKSQKPIITLNGLEVYKGVTNNLFYKGVKVYTSEKPYMYHYNLTNHTQLTEDRQLKYESYDNHHTLASLLMSIEDSEFISKLTKCGNRFAEYHLGYCSGTPCEPLKVALRKTLGEVDNKVPRALESLCKPSMSEQLRQKDDLELEGVQKMQLEKAKGFLINLKLYKEEYPIRVMDTLGDGVLGLADRDSDTIYLSENVFNLGTKYVAGTLYEEYIHLKYGVDDETRAFQDVVINHLMSVGETLVQEPL